MGIYNRWWGAIDQREWFKSFDVKTYSRPQIALPDMHEMTARRPIPPVTMGQEIEQPEEYLDRNLIEFLVSKRNGHYDGSGPFEWGYGPYIYPSQMLRLFFKDVDNMQWEWVNEYGIIDKGCGSHWHFRPNNERMRQFAQFFVDYWTICINTINEMLPVLFPFAIHGKPLIYVPRKTASRWSRPRYRRWSIHSVRQILANPYFSWHEYYVYEFNGGSYNSKPLTIEIRISETHPIISATGQRLMSYIINHYFKKLEERLIAGGSLAISPKLMGGREIITRFYNRVIMDRENLWDVMLNTGPIVFEPRRGPTYLFTKRFFKNEYRSLLELFMYTIYEQLALYPEKERNKDWFWRVLWLMYNRGIPADEGFNIWEAYTYKGADFKWDNVPAYTGKLPKPEEMLD